MANRTTAPAMAKPVSVIEPAPNTSPRSGCSIQPAATTLKTNATFFSGPLIGPRASSMAATELDPAPIASLENGKAKRVKISHASGNITTAIGVASSIQCANVIWMPIPAADSLPPTRSAATR